MTGKLPFDAFEHYLALGADRSYKAVADHFGVSKRSVTKRATKENWQDRIAELERKAHDAAEKRAFETLKQMAIRHIRICKTIQKKALENLQAVPLMTAMEAVRALNISLKQERLARGEPTERTANVEEVIKKEYTRWLTGPEEDSDDRDTSETTE